MNPQTFEVQLLETFSQEGIASANRKHLLHLAEKVEIDTQDYYRIRAAVFDLAQSQGVISFEWLEDAMKILDKAREITYTSAAYFSPERSGRDELALTLKSAKKAIWVCVFTISDNELALALIDQHRNGLDVKVLTDNDKIFDRGSEIVDMKNAGLKVKIDDTRHHMHHKFAIIDHETLVNGSYNWTRSADEFNHENLVITRDDALVKAFRQEFNRLWDELNWL